ncbi:hypothetical protein VNI00_016441 [Paramarasmius palmivorus]|uniref:Uncharacterized protein n=1 Tax=Paramarasmius palmivorus TaxID=297713 RepID=A0AAW0BDX7_9AGAR
MPTDNVAERIDIQVQGPHDDTTADLTDGTLVPGSADPGGSGLQALNENNALPPDSDEPRTPRRMVAEGTNPGDSEVQVMASNSVTEGLSISSSAGDEPGVLRKAVPPDTDTDRFTQAPENGAQAASLSFEGQGGPTGFDHGGPGIVDTGGTAADSGQDTHTVSDNISLAILEPPDLRAAGIRSSHQGNNVGSDGISGRIGWNPTNDPNALRVYWFRP